MSPEQLDAQPIDERSDLWALAVMSFQMLTGQHPFQGEGLLLLRDKVRKALFTRPSTLVTGLTPEIDTFFQRALAVEPKDRFPSATHFASELLRLTDSSACSTVTRILFLDDEPDMELLLRRRFREELRDGRYELYFASNGQTGLRELAMRPEIDAVLTDLNMPEMDGLTFLERVPEVNPFVRVVVVSAYSDMTNIRMAMNRGAFDFLVKPIDFNDLQRTIEKCANHTSELRRASRANEENEILRAVVGPQSVDKLVASIRASDSIAHDASLGTVAFVGVPSLNQRLAQEQPTQLIAELNTVVQVVAQEVLHGGGTVGRLFGEVMMVAFQGQDHALRAGEVALAIRDRIRTINDERTPAQSPLVVSIGLASGTLITAGLGSRSLGRLEPTYLGQPVNRAAALQRAAHADEILVHPDDLSSLAETYSCEYLPERPLTIAGETALPCRLRGRVRTSGWHSLSGDGGVLTADVQLPRPGTGST